MSFAQEMVVQVIGRDCSATLRFIGEVIDHEKDLFAAYPAINAFWYHANERQKAYVLQYCGLDDANFDLPVDGAEKPSEYILKCFKHIADQLTEMLIVH
jgi:hypothetical protein